MLYQNIKTGRYVWVRRFGVSIVSFESRAGIPKTMNAIVFSTKYRLVTAEHIEEMMWAIRQKAEAEVVK